MGYTTEFDGQFAIEPPLAEDHHRYLETFAKVRHMRRNATQLASTPDRVRTAGGLPLGVDGEFYVGSTRNFGQDITPDVTHPNDPPATQPGLWCQWAPNEYGDALEWDGGEKFYNYVEWLEYLIANFFEPWGYTLNGTVEWEGEDRSDAGSITVTNNTIHVIEF